MSKNKKGKAGKKDKATEAASKPVERSSDEKLDAVLNGINVLAGAVGKLVEIHEAGAADKGKTSESVADVRKTHFEPKLDDETYPSDYIPPKFKKIVHEVLSPEFGLQIVDFEDRTDFQVNIIVPEKYSSITAEDKEKGVKDIRSRMIPRALGENGIRDWCKLIRQNLNKYYSREGVQSPFNHSVE
jgi:hypothetical protein